jgi:nucleoside-diphosphate-sugar epimerase
MRVASRWLRQGDCVFAITRSTARVNELRQSGIEPIVWDWLSGELPAANLGPTVFERESPALSTILIAVSHSPQLGLPPIETHARGLNHLASLLETTPGWELKRTQTKWIYLSTTGVFGPTPPEGWVDENSPVSPERPGSIAAWAGEQWIASHVSEDMRVTLRPAGIYGPDRVPRWEAIRDQTPLQVDPESYLNLIHIDDLAETIRAVSSTNMRSSLYCVSDGTPVRRREYYAYIARLGNWPNPIFESPNPHGTGRVGSRSDGNKKIRNHRIQAELEVRYAYPSYREGLKSLLSP